MTIQEVIQAIAVCGGFVGAGTTILIYWRNSRLRRVEWLYQLYDKFFHLERHSEIRKLIDYGSKAELDRLQKELRGSGRKKLEEKLVDFLNFFEFIASLWKLKQLRLNEILMMFDYYLRRIGDHQFIMIYLKDNGFEGLIDLIDQARKQKK